jgi:WXG100 family type VII secretion target
MSKIGGELGQLESLKTTFDRESQTVATLMSTINGQVGNTWWVGPAADRFRNAWNSEFQPALRKLQQALTEAGQEVNRRREALQQAGS